MTRIIRCCLLFACCAGLLPAMVVPEKRSANQVATAYFEALTAGDVATLETLYAAPFSCDGEKLADVKAVAAMHGKVIGYKGKRPVPTYTAGPDEDAGKLDAAIWGDHLPIRVTITDGEHQGTSVVIYVKEVQGQFLVVGFKD